MMVVISFMLNFLPPCKINYVFKTLIKIFLKRFLIWKGGLFTLYTVHSLYSHPTEIHFNVKIKVIQSNHGRAFKHFSHTFHKNETFERKHRQIVEIWILPCLFMHLCQSNFACSYKCFT